MSIKARYLTKHIKEDLKEKMVFLGGPRQVGKTTAARDLISRLISQPLQTGWTPLSCLNV